MWTVSDQPAGHDVLDRVMGPGLPVGDEGQLWFARSSGLSGGWPEGYLPAKGLTVTKAFLSQSQVTEPESCFLLLLLFVWFVFLFFVCVYVARTEQRSGHVCGGSWLPDSQSLKGLWR